jgi:succinoglycan biosynthesis transport protein ExoP
MNGSHEQNESQSPQAGMTPYATPTPGIGAGYDSLFEIIWRGKWLAVLSTVVALAGAYYYSRWLTPLYDSTSRVLVEKPGQRPTSDVPLPVGSTGTNYLQTQANMITTREIIATALRDPNVLAFSGLRDPNVMQALVSSLSAVVPKNTDMIAVTARSAYPEDAARFVNAVVRAYIGWHVANRQLSTADLLKDLNSQLEKRYQELQAKRKERLMFEQRHPEVIESVQGGIGSKRLDMLSQDLSSARLKTIQEDLYYEGLKRFESEPNNLVQYVRDHRAATAATVPANDAERIRLEDELFHTRSQLEELSTAGAAQHNRITLLQNQVKEIEKRIADLSAASTQKEVQEAQKELLLAKARSEDARAWEKQLTDVYAKEFANTQNLSGQNAEYALLVSESSMMENLCNSLLKQINALDVNARFEELNIHVLEQALPAMKPSTPGLVMIMGIGLVLGLMAGIGLAFVRDWRDQRVRSADEITAILGVPVLGTVPKISKRGLVARAQTLRTASSSRESEAYRAIRTALLFGTPWERAMTVLVTSPGPHEGKTILVSNLGIAMAQAGQRTLILDADLRKPMQHRIFGLNGDGRGLTNVLAQTIPLDEAIRPTEVQGLDVLTSGQNAPNPSDLLNSKAFGNLLEGLKRKYDCILVDSPPVGLVTDAQILAARCSVTLLVLRARRSERMTTQRARDALLTVGARVAGAIVNDVSKKDSSKYSHYSGYAYHYGYYGSSSPRAAVKELPAEIVPPRKEDGPLGNYLDVLLNHGPDEKTPPRR